MAETGLQEKSFFEVSPLHTRQADFADEQFNQARSSCFQANQTCRWPKPSSTTASIRSPDVHFAEPNQDRNLGTQSNKKVDIYIRIKNAEANGLGIPLPAGRIRVYKKDEADAAQEFIGEDVIQHTPKDDELLVKLGSAFDIVGERKQTDINVDMNGHFITESFEIVIRNHKKEAATVLIKENRLRWTNWEITQSSDKFESRITVRSIFLWRVAADGTKTGKYTWKYTW